MITWKKNDKSSFTIYFILTLLFAFFSNPFKRNQSSFVPCFVFEFIWISNFSNEFQSLDISLRAHLILHLDLFFSSLALPSILRLLVFLFYFSLSSFALFNLHLNYFRNLPLHFPPFTLPSFLPLRFLPFILPLFLAHTILHLFFFLLLPLRFPRVILLKPFFFLSASLP